MSSFHYLESSVFLKKNYSTLLFKSCLSSNAMLLVGLTGGIGSGKSTVSRFLKERGVHVIDADQIAREVVEPGRPANDQLKQAFGAEYFEDDVLNREKLAELARRELNKITHAAIRKEMIKRIFLEFISGQKIVVLDVPLLFETGLQKLLQVTITVSCDVETQISRLEKRDGMSREQAHARIDAQLPNDVKVKLATHVVDNTGSIDSTKAQVDAIVDQLESSWIPFLVRFFIAAFITSSAIGLSYLLK